MLQKFKRKLWGLIVDKLRHKPYYPGIYRSYWRYRFSSSSAEIKQRNYFTAIPNPGAGIGHQLANWIAGYWFARKFGLSFAHSPFPDLEWEYFFGFGRNETSTTELLQQGYKKVLLPLFDEFNSKEVDLISKSITSHADQRVVFFAEQDQFYRNQYDVMKELQAKFYAAESRNQQQLIFTKACFNIAVHIRKGDIVNGQKKNNANLQMRWLDNRYFERILSEAISNLNIGKPIIIYLFSQGSRTDFPEFEKFENMHFCLDMNTQQSLLHMIHADLLITSKSSFSYKPALLCQGIKICPKNFWHGYPQAKDWILAEDDGEFEVSKLQNFSF